MPGFGGHVSLPMQLASCPEGAGLGLRLLLLLMAGCGLDGERRGRGKGPGQGTRKPSAPAHSSLSIKTVTHTQVLSRSRARDQCPLQRRAKEGGAEVTGVSTACVLQLNPTDPPHPEGVSSCAPTLLSHLAAPKLVGVCPARGGCPGPTAPSGGANVEQQGCSPPSALLPPLP